MKAIIAAFTLAIQELKTKAESAFSGLGPADQHEGAPGVGYASSALQWVTNKADAMLQQITDLEAKFDPEVQAAAAALLPALLAEKVTAGEYIAKSDVEAAVAAAKQEATQAAEAAFQAREEQVATITARRSEIETAHGTEVAASVSADSLTGEGFESLKTELGRRVTALSEIGVTAAANKDAFAKIACGHSFDEDGGKAFDENVTLIKGLVPKGSAQAAASAPKVPGSGQPTAPATAPTKTESSPYAF